jgi:hypothetical protein
MSPNDANELYALIPIFSVIFGCPALVVLGMLAFPSTRAALARRLAGRAAGERDDEAVAHIVSTEAHVTALRSEVYALRCEVAALPRALPPAAQAMAGPPLIPASHS